jgi:hypothetical protein
MNIPIPKVTNEINSFAYSEDSILKKVQDYSENFKMYLHFLGRHRIHLHVDVDVFRLPLPLNETEGFLFSGGGSMHPITIVVLICVVAGGVIMLKGIDEIRKGR